MVETKRNVVETEIFTKNDVKSAVVVGQKTKMIFERKLRFSKFQAEIL